MQQAPYQTDETTNLIIAFPEDFTDSATLEDLEGAAQMEYEAKLDAQIAANYGDCGHPLHTPQGIHEENMERMAEIYGYGPPA